jgi:hypothetical protein
VSLLSYFDSNYFTTLAEPLKGLQLGQLVFVPVPNLDVHPNVIEATRDGTSHKAATARWTTLSDRHFTRRDGKELPILYFNLGATEEVVAYKAKRRPAVVVGMGSTLIGGIPGLPPHQEEGRVVVAPIYGIRSAEDPKGFSERLSDRIAHLLYQQYFPLAAWRENRSDCTFGGSLDAGVVRFDRLQFVTPHAPSCRPRSIRVTDDVLALMHGMLWLYLHAQPTEGLDEMRRFLAELHASGSP